MFGPLGIAFVERYAKIRLPVWLIASSIVLLGLILRIAFFWTVQPGFDQVQILEQATFVSTGDFTLVGPRTGPAEMFTGPLIYYLAAPILAIMGPWATITVVPALIAMATGVGLFLITKRYIDRTHAWLVLAFWAVSPFIVQLDRVLWNPNLVVLAASLLVLPMVTPADNNYFAKSAWLDLVLLASGAFLAFQAHFSGLVAVALAGGWIVLDRSWKKLAALSAGLGLSLLPTVVFDIRNNWLNTRGLWNFLTDQTGGTGLTASLIKTPLITLETIGKLVVPSAAFPFLVVAGVGVALFGTRAMTKSWLQVPLMYWVIGTGLIFTLYTGQKPEYYFLMIVPVGWFWLSSWLLAMPLWNRVVGLSLWAGAAVWLNLQISAVETGPSLATIQEIQAKLETQPVSQVTYDLEPGQEFGLQYALKDITTSETGTHIHVGYPYKGNYWQAEKVGEVGLWPDPRTEEKTFYETDQFFVSVASPFQLVADSTHTQFWIMDDTTVAATLTVNPGSNPTCSGLSTTDWSEISADSFTLATLSHHWCLELTLLQPAQYTLEELQPAVE